MAYTFLDPILGAQAISETSTTARHPLGTTRKAYDPTYGEGEFVYALGVASTAIGSWVTFSPDDWSTALLVAGAVGKVGVAMSANVASQYGWYQTSGKAIGKALVGYVDNALVYATATAGSIDDAAVSGDLVASAKGASAVGTPSAGLAEFEIDDPSIDSTTGYGAGITALTDNSGGAAADGTIGVVTAPTAIGSTLTDNSGLVGTHDDTVAATPALVTLTDNSGYSGTHDDTLAAAATPTTLTDNTGGSGTHDDTLADGLTVTAFAADNGSGAADGTIEAETNIDLLVDGTGGAVDNTVAAVPASYSNSMMAYQLGRNGAGALALANVEVGDDVLLVANITDAADDTALYEATISVQNQIQQTGAGDHSAKMNIFVIRRSFEGVLNNNLKELTDQAITQRSANTAIFNNTKDLAAKVATLITDVTAQNQNDSDLAQKIMELVTQNAALAQNQSDVGQKVIELVAREAVTAQNVSDITQKVIELVTAQGEDRTAIVALTDAVKELATKLNAIIAA